ncbi:MAG: twin-arginine translocase subunit TatC [Acidobacteriota bacterium]|nr:twin-arginine translocase subunit TatC [Acidobacteriota bacterium]
MSEPEPQRGAPPGSPLLEAGRRGPEGARMSFLAHLDELRRRLLRVALGLLVGVAASYAFGDEILEFLLGPVEDAVGDLTVIRPAEAFMNKIKAAFAGGLFVTLPWAFYQAWAFVAPGLYARERKWVVPAVACAFALFTVGAAFCYWVALPAAIGFLAEQAQAFESNVTVDHAFSFSVKLLFGMGLVFEMPLVIFVLARAGLVTARFLWKKLDLAVFFCFLTAAIITPTPDVLTMTIFALPMVALYLCGIVVAWLAAPRQAGQPTGGTERDE